jgi:carboxylesterase type B
MKMRSFNIAFLAAILSLEAHAVPHSNRKVSVGTGLLVETTSGNIQGFINHTAPDVRQFLGVPFAEPPVGQLRFAKPQAKQPNGTVKALTLPNSCMQQFDSSSSTIYTEYETGFLVSGGNSEDCLYLSIWAPKVENIQSQQRPLPVLLYIPGGGFTSGGQASLYKIPDKWVQRTQSHIVVIMK